MDALTAPVVLQRRVPAEEAARADFYALLARLFHDAPDAALLAALAHAPELEAGSPLAGEWRDLTWASRAMDADAARTEYDALFVGVGKAEVSIYAGYYLGAPAADHPRVRLQRELAAMSLAPRDGNPEPEDHLAGLFDVMRVLVAGGAGREPASLADQRRFFETYIARATQCFCAATKAAPAANYYRKVAQFAAAFVSFESKSFELE
jgi:TorA maturation chaperone TorD